MRGMLVALVCGLMVAGLAVCAVPTAEAELETAVGDYWKYEYDGSYEGMDMSGDLMYEVEEITTVDGYEAFRVVITGSSEFSMEIEGISASGEVEMRGYELHLASNYALLEMSLLMEYDMNMDGNSISMKMGVIGTYEPPAECFMGNDSLVLDTPVNADCIVTSTAWIYFEGQNVSESFTYDVSQTVTLVDDSTEVETPVGTLDCQKIRFEMLIEDQSGLIEPQSMTVDNYYCEDVGNFVTGSGNWMLTDYGISDIELKAYSYNGVTAGESSSILSGNGPLLIGVLLIAVVVVLVVVVRRGRQKQAALEAPGMVMPPGIAPPMEGELAPGPAGIPPPEAPPPPGAV